MSVSMPRRASFRPGRDGALWLAGSRASADAATRDGVDDLSLAEATKDVRVMHGPAAGWAIGRRIHRAPCMLRRSGRSTPKGKSRNGLVRDSDAVRHGVVVRFVAGLDGRPELRAL